MSVIKFNRKIEDFVQFFNENLEKGDFEKAALYAMKIKNIDEVEGLRKYAVLYGEMGLVSSQYKAYFKLYNITHDKKYLSHILNDMLADQMMEQCVKYDDFGVSAFVPEEDARINKDELIAFLEEYQENQPPKFKVVSKDSKERLLKDIEKATDLLNEGELVEALNLLNSKDFSSITKEEDYSKYISIKAHCYYNLGKFDELEEFAKELSEIEECKQYGYMILCFIYAIIKHDEEKTKEYIHKLMEVEDIAPIVLLAVPIVLAKTHLIEEGYFFAKKITSRMNFTETDLAYKAVLEFILGNKTECKKTLNYADKLFGYTSFICVTRAFLESCNEEFTTFQEYGDNLEKFINSALKVFCKDPTMDFNLIPESALLTYTLEQGNEKQVEMALDVLCNKFFDFGLVKELLLNVRISNEIKNKLIFFYYEYFTKNVEFIIDGVYFDLDLKLPKHMDDYSMLYAYIYCVGFACVNSLRPFTTVKRCKKVVTKIYNDYVNLTKQQKHKYGSELINFILDKILKEEELQFDKDLISETFIEDENEYKKFLQLIGEEK